MTDPNDPFADFPDWARPKPKVDTSVLALATPDPPRKEKGKGKRTFVKKEVAPDPNAPQPEGEAPKGHLEFWSYAFSEGGDYNFTHSKEFPEAVEEAWRLFALAPDEGDAPYVRAVVYYGDKVHAFREANAAWSSEDRPVPVPVPAAERPAKKSKTAKADVPAKTSEAPEEGGPSKAKRSRKKKAEPIGP